MNPARWMPVRKSYVAGCASYMKNWYHQRLCHHDQEEATEVFGGGDESGHDEQADAPDECGVNRQPASYWSLWGEVNRLTGTVRGGQFHVGAHRWPLVIRPRTRPVDLFLRPWRWILPPHQPRFSATSMKRSLEAVAPEKVTIPASGAAAAGTSSIRSADGGDGGDDVPQRGERLFVGLRTHVPIMVTSVLSPIL